MAMKTVLAIGIDPAVVDVSRFPGLTSDLLRSYIDAELRRLGDDGYDVVPCLVDFGATATQVTTAALASRPFDCVMIGAGLRESPEFAAVRADHQSRPSARPDGSHLLQHQPGRYGRR